MCIIPFGVLTLLDRWQKGIQLVKLCSSYPQKKLLGEITQTGLTAEEECLLNKNCMCLQMNMFDVEVVFYDTVRCALLLQACSSYSHKSTTTLLQITFMHF